MNYIGSKYKLSSFIKETVYSVVGNNISDMVFCDLFAGTGIVGRIFKNEVKQIISNDFEYYSYVLIRNYIGNNNPVREKDMMIELLNALKPVEGFIFNNYCFGGATERRYFSDENGKKIDAIRQKIEKLKKNKTIDEDTYFFLLASLLESADKVANTASVYGAYLKQIKKTAQKPLILEPAGFETSPGNHKVFQEDSNQLILNIEGDILYLDPPYNSRQYGANYHILNTIAKYDTFTPKGKTGLRDYQKSEWCSKNKVETVFEQLIRNARFRYIFLSYNNEGLMSAETVKRIMKKYGKYDLSTTGYQRFKADTDINRNHKADKTEEYLHILEKR